MDSFAQLRTFWRTYFDKPLVPIRRLRYDINIAARICGVSVYNEWKFNVFTFIAIMTSCNFVVFSIYTVWYLWADPVKCLQVLCCYGVFIPNSMKLYICIRLRRQIINFLEFGEAIYTDDASPTSNRQNCLRKCAKQSYHYLGLLLSVSVIGALLFVAYPLYLLAFENKRTWILPVLIPGTTLDTFAEYYTNITYQVACSLIALCGSTGYDCYFTLCVCHYSTCVALIESTANETVADRDRRWRIRALILQLQDIDSFIVQMNNLNKGVLLVQPLASAFSISLSLFCIITNDWIAGYGYVIFAFTKMLSLCAVGQSVQNDNTRLVHILYGLPWYRFTIDQQKDIRRILMRLHRSKELWMGPFAPLNLETGSTITQNVYTFAMMLLRTTE